MLPQHERAVDLLLPFYLQDFAQQQSGGLLRQIASNNMLTANVKSPALRDRLVNTIFACVLVIWRI